MGETGPCGPCSEIHYYMGDDPDDAENCAANVNGPGDTITEIWNLVFMQFERSESEDGNPTAGGNPTVREGAKQYALTPLPAPSVDTGMGLERLTVVLQGVKSNYETDLLRNIVEFVAKLSDRKYVAETQEGFAMRVIADHARATAFSIADGILPANEGRNYVLRKIMRRAIYQGRNALGFEGLFFHKVTNFVVDQMGEAYPELEAHRGFIDKMVRLEEERFGSTLTVGLQDLHQILDKIDPQAGMIPAEKLVQLTVPTYDTKGLPRDLIRIAVIERGYGFAQDEDAFNEMFDSELRRLQQSGSSEKADEKVKSKPVYASIARRVQSLFRGYETTRVDDAKVLAIVRDDEEVSDLGEGQSGEAVLDQTPFYAESGGQVGDVGRIVGPPATAGGSDTPAVTSGTGVPPVNHAQDARATLVAQVVDTHSPAQGLIVHKVKVEKGTLK